VSLWEERAARNEALFREVNEEVERLTARLGGGGDRADFVCECSQAECTEWLRVPLGLYESVRAAPRRFLLVAGHERSEFESVVERGAGYVVVEKEGTAGRIADGTDPRS
jgi:hypothetical protein